MALSPNRAIRALAPAAFAALALAGCGGLSQKAYTDQEMDFGAIRTVAVLPFQNLTREQYAGDRVRDTFANMLLATGSVYVLPQGEVARAMAQIGVQSPAPTVDEVVRLGKTLRADAIVSGTVREYGEVKSGNAAGNLVSVTVQLLETGTGKVVWSASSTKGGVTVTARLFGSSGPPLNAVTEEAVDELLEKLF